MRSVALALLLAAALLSGCLVEEADPNAQSTDDEPFGSDPGPAGEAPVAPPPADEDDEDAPEPTPAAPHGVPQWENGTVTTGMDPNRVPGAWARQDVSVRNGFGDLVLGDLSAAVAAGGITLVVEDRADYLVQASLEVRAPSEEQAREVLERTRLDHRDAVEGDRLVLRDEAVTDTAAGPLPIPIPLTVTGDVQLIVHLAITLPKVPAVDADLVASSGDLLVQSLRGGSLEASTSSGGVLVKDGRFGRAGLSASSGDVLVMATLAEEMEAITSSGDITLDAVTVGQLSVSASSGDAVLKGVFDSIDAHASSGSVFVEAEPARSGSYVLGASSGSVTLRLPAEGHAYKATADTSSGDIAIELEGAETKATEDHAEATTPGFKGAKLATTIEATTSSGDIDIRSE